MAKIQRSKETGEYRVEIDGKYHTAKVRHNKETGEQRLFVNGESFPVPGTQQDTQYTVSEALTAIPGRALRSATGLIAAIPDAFIQAANGVNALAGGDPNYFTRLGDIEKVYDRLGVPRSRSDLEKIGDAGMEALASAAGGIGLGKGLSRAASPVAQRLGAFLSEAPVSQAISSGAASGSAELARQNDIGPVGQSLAALGAGVVGPSVPAMVNNAKANVGRALVKPQKAAVFEAIGETPPSLGAISDSGLLQYLEGALGSLFPSAGTMKRAGEKGQAILEREVARAQDDIARGHAVPQSIEEMGSVAQEAADASRRDFSAKARDFEDRVYAPAEQLPANTQNLQDFIGREAALLNEASRSPVAAAYRGRLEKDAADILAASNPDAPTLNVRGLRKYRQDVGDRLKSAPTATTGTVSQRELNEIYNAVGDDLMAALPDATAEEVRAYNRWYSKEKQLRDKVEGRYFRDRSSKETGKRLMAADSEYLQSLRSVIGDDAFGRVSAGVLGETVRGNDAATSANYAVSRLGEGRSRISPEARQLLFRGRDQQVEDLADALKSSQAFLNRSNTANAATLGNVGAIIAAPATFGASLAIPAAAARTFTSPRVIDAARRWQQRQYSRGAGANAPAAIQGLLPLLEGQ